MTSKKSIESFIQIHPEKLTKRRYLLSAMGLLLVSAVDGNAKQPAVQQHRAIDQRSPHNTIHTINWSGVGSDVGAHRNGYRSPHLAPQCSDNAMITDYFYFYYYYNND